MESLFQYRAVIFRSRFQCALTIDCVDVPYNYLRCFLTPDTPADCTFTTFKHRGQYNSMACGTLAWKIYKAAVKIISYARISVIDPFRVAPGKTDNGPWHFKNPDKMQGACRVKPSFTKRRCTSHFVLNPLQDNGNYTYHLI